MVQKLICPDCNKPSYTSDDGIYSPCPYCGLVFSKNGYDKRKEKRFDWKVNCQVSVKDGQSNNINLTAITQDVSQNGMGIRYTGVLLAAASAVDVCITDLNLRRTAKVMWSKTVCGQTVESGIYVAEPLPMSSLGF